MTTRPYENLQPPIRSHLREALKHIERIYQGTIEERLCQIAYTIAQSRAATALLEHAHQVTVADAIRDKTGWPPDEQ